MRDWGHQVRCILVFLEVDVIVHSVREPTPTSVTQTAGPSEAPITHKFTTEYHPNSGRAPETQDVDEHSRKRKRFSPPSLQEPWLPFFKTREDFIFSELLLEMGSSKDQCERLIRLIRRCLDGRGSLTISSYSDFRGAWERASSRLTPVSLGFISEINHSPFQGLVPV